MKNLEKRFVCNTDKSGDNTFVEAFRQDNVAVYDRYDTEGKYRGSEVFIVKVVKEGAPLPNGTFVSESYEQYPGTHAFGKTAWYTNVRENAIQRANQLIVSEKQKADGIENGTNKKRGRPAKAKS